MNNGKLWFRRMTPDDIEQVMRVEREVYEFPWSERIFSDCIRVGYFCWLALQQALYKRQQKEIRHLQG